MDHRLPPCRSLLPFEGFLVSLNRQLKTLQPEFDSSAAMGVRCADAENDRRAAEGRRHRAQVCASGRQRECHRSVRPFGSQVSSQQLPLGRTACFAPSSSAALAALRADIGRIDATLVAMSPQAPDHSDFTGTNSLRWPSASRHQNQGGAEIRHRVFARGRTGPIYAGSGARTGVSSARRLAGATHVVDRTGRAAPSYLDTGSAGRLELASNPTTLS